MIHPFYTDQALIFRVHFEPTRKAEKKKKGLFSSSPSLIVTLLTAITLARIGTATTLREKQRRTASRKKNHGHSIT